jgi:hypothetical protein
MISLLSYYKSYATTMPRVVRDDLMYISYEAGWLTPLVNSVL